LEQVEVLFEQFFFEKYGPEGSALDKNSLQLIQFMDTASHLVLKYALPFIARMVKMSAVIPIEPELRKELIYISFVEKPTYKKKYTRRQQNRNRNTQRNYANV
jgi:hypothetical protein